MNDPVPRPPGAVIPGWRTMLSDAGRWWATRVEPFDPAAEAGGAYRTVDADTLDDLIAAAAAQEEAARNPPPPVSPSLEPRM